MKEILLMLGVFCGGVVMAQNTFSSSNEVVNGTYAYFVCDSNANNLSATNGTNATWDYSQLAKYAGQTKNIIIDNNANTTDFPSATRSIDISGLMMDFLKTDATARTRYGISIVEPTLGSVSVKLAANPATLMNYPFAFGDSFNDAFSGTMDISALNINGNPASGTRSTIYDGVGTFKVGAQSIPNVSRVVYHDTITTTIPLLGSAKVYLNQYEYYDLDNTKEPIFIIISVIVYQGTTTTPLMDNTLVLSKYEPSGTVATAVVADDIHLSLSPNPVTDYVTLNGDFDNANVQIVDQSGRVVYQGQLKSGSTIPTVDFNSGIYVVKATIGQQTITKKIVKM